MDDRREKAHLLRLGKGSLMISSSVELLEDMLVLIDIMENKVSREKKKLAREYSIFVPI